MQRSNDLNLCAVGDLAELFFVILTLAKILALTITRSFTRASSTVSSSVICHILNLHQLFGPTNQSFHTLPISSPGYLAMAVAFAVVVFS